MKHLRRVGRKTGQRQRVAVTVVTIHRPSRHCRRRNFGGLFYFFGWLGHFLVGRGVVPFEDRDSARKWSFGHLHTPTQTPQYGLPTVHRVEKTPYRGTTFPSCQAGSVKGVPRKTLNYASKACATDQSCICNRA